MYQNIEPIKIEGVETLNELAARWKVKDSWIYSRTRETGEGSIPRIKLGRHLRFITEEVDAWARENSKC